MTGEQIMDVENKESNGRIYMSVSPEAVLKVESKYCTHASAAEPNFKLRPLWSKCGNYK